MLRTCMYCGRELKPNEVCSCPSASAHRARKNDNTEGKENYNNPYKTETSYRTGYVNKDSKFERARTRHKIKRAAKKSNPKKSAKGFFSYIKSFILSPIDMIANPPHMSKAAMLVIAAAQGAFLWLCIFSILRGGAVGVLKYLASVMSFNGAQGYRLAAAVPAVLLSGALSGIVIFFVYTGIFYLINRFIMRLKTPFWELCVRLVSAWIPFTIICAIGSVLSIFSPVTIVVLLVCGGITVGVLTYEGLKTEWVSYPAGKVLYAMFLGYFILFSIVSHLLFI